MLSLSDSHIQTLARSCVTSMGDIFWDFHEGRDVPIGFTAPAQVAISCVASTLQSFAATLQPDSVYTIPLRLEYREIVGLVGDSANEADIVAALASQGAWTREGARTIVQLAQTYGVSVLRNALALAEALGIEDGKGRL
ncbi:MAG: hypothetical protein L6Q35_12135 [Phycisphaerales bacterium]|nr:hypothetical protein [Phycisphaerales bacterium]